MSALTTNLDRIKLRDDLFKDVKYFVTGNLDAKVEKLLKEGGGSSCNYLIGNTTHLLCGEGFDENEIAQAADLYEIPSITEAWVIASAKLGRLALTKAYDPTPNSKCFSQVHACISQVPTADRHCLYAMITFNGGVVERNFTSKTSHLICGAADGPAYAKAITIKNDNFSVVTPDWIIDSLKGQELRDPQMYHPRLLTIPQQLPTAQQKSAVVTTVASANNNDTDKQSLSSILGLDFEESIEKSDIPILRDEVQINSEKSAAASMTSQINSILQSVSASPSSSTLLMASNQQRPQLNQHMMLQRQSLVNQAEQQQSNKVSNQTPQQMRNTQAIATTASIQQQITAINQQHQYNQQQKLLAASIGKSPAATLNRSISEIVTSTAPNNPTLMTGPDFLRQQSTQSHQILTQSNKVPLQNMQQTGVMTQSGQIQPGQSQMSQQTGQIQINNQNQPQQQIIISQGNPVITQKHIINTSTAQGQQIIQSHLMSQQQRQQNAVAQSANILMNPQSQQSGLISGVNATKQQIQFIHTNAGQQQQVKIIQQNQQHVMTAQQLNKPLVQGQGSQPPPHRIIISQQQFSQLNPQQQQQLIHNSQNQNIVIINQASGQSQQIINSSQQLQQVGNLGQNPQQMANQQSLQQQQIQRNLQKGVANIQQSPQSQPNQNFMQQQQQTQSQPQMNIDQSPQHQSNAGATSPQNQLNTQQSQSRMQYLHNLQQQHQTQQQQMLPSTAAVVPNEITEWKIQQIKMQLQQVGNTVSPRDVQQQPTMSQQTIHNNQQIPQQLLQSPNIQSSIAQSTQQQQIIQNQQVASPQQQSQQQIISSQAQQKIQIQNQIIVQQQPGLVQQQASQWTPQSPVQQQPQGGIIRSTRPQWPPQPVAPGTQRQLIHLDAQTHAHIQSLDPLRRTEYLTKLQQKQRERSIMLRQQVGFPGARPGATSIAVAGQRPTGAQHIILRGQMPAGMTQQQQVQWVQQVQQQGARPLLVRGGAPGLSPISQNPSPISQQPGFQVDSNSSTQQQQLQQIQIQRQQQYQRMQQIQQQQNRTSGPQAVSPRGGFPETTPDLSSVATPTTAGVPNQIQIAQDPNSQPPMNKTKTALANMLSNRIGNNSNIAPIPETPEPSAASAAGTLRLMTAQHNAALNQSVNQRTPQELAVIQQTQQAQQQAAQRRTLGNITNSTNATPGPVVVNQIQPVAAPVAVSHSPSSIKRPFSPGRQTIRPQFYGHNPNLKLPSVSFLVGCIFFIVEYDELFGDMLPVWKELIQQYGGEIEQMYCPRVTHVLCRTQRHGVVMQAIRDSKRCVTAYWLNDAVQIRRVSPPWQALHLPMPSTFGNQRPATRHTIGISGFEGEERIRIKNMVEESGAKLTTYFSRHNTILICKRPEGPKYKRAKDWNIPVVNTVWLSDILLGNLSGMTQFEIAKYQQYNITGPFRIDYGLVPHLMTAWKSPINLTPEQHERVKRIPDLPEESYEPKPKKMRTIPPLEEVPEEILCNELPEPDKVPRILFSQIDNIEGLTNAVKLLGGQVVEKPSDATHLVVSRLVRSNMLLLAVTSVDHILSSKWIVDSAKAGKFLSVDGYEMNDPQFKQTFKADVQTTIQSSSRRTLFEGKTFFITPKVRPSRTALASLIESSGGRVDKHRLSAARISETNAQKPGSYIVLSCVHDLHLLSDLMRSNRPNRIICSTEFVMSSILTQNIDLERHIIKYS